jgi:hypothetical protein
MNQIYRDLLHNLAKRAVMDATAIKGLLHNGLKGQLRELFVRELLLPMLPSEYVVGSGNVITAYNEVSNQLDVIVCDRRVIPPVLFEGAVGIFPVESALLTVEVKSTLNAHELGLAHASAERVTSFKHSVLGTKAIEHVGSCLFAFATDLTPGGKSEIERYKEMDGSDEPALRLICVVGRGCWFWAEGKWNNWEFGGEYGEVVAFLVSIANTIQRVAATRTAPDIREYVQCVHAEDQPAPELGA